MAGTTDFSAATLYQNENEVGQGIHASGVPRESIFLTTKLNNIDQHRPAAALEDSLEALQTPYLDLWLMHWPTCCPPWGTTDSEIDWLDTWRAMEAIHKENPDKVRAIGVSNFCIEYLERLVNNAEIIPAVNQIETHPYVQILCC
jgi:glycerol 2-dehydrogenase (NADP+)